MSCHLISLAHPRSRSAPVVPGHPHVWRLITPLYVKFVLHPLVIVITEIHLKAGNTVEDSEVSRCSGPSQALRPLNGVKCGGGGPALDGVTLPRLLSGCRQQGNPLPKRSKTARSSHYSNPT